MHNQEITQLSRDPFLCERVRLATRHDFKNNKSAFRIAYHVNGYDVNNNYWQVESNKSATTALISPNFVRLISRPWLPFVHVWGLGMRINSGKWLLLDWFNWGIIIQSFLPWSAEPNAMQQVESNKSAKECAQMLWSNYSLHFYWRCV